MFHFKWRKIFQYVVVVNYCVAALIFVAAGLLKLADPAVGDILNTLVDRDSISLQQMVLIYRMQPWLEIGLGIFALIGWQPQWSARIMAVLYLFFSGLVFYVVEGNLAMPISCGCFGGEEGGSAAYLTFYRNVVIASFLVFFTSSHRNATLYSVIMQRLRKA